jgi:predicted alpha/beta superfamily hydrolase
VLDADTHAVLPGVTIRLPQLPGGTTSQANGAFSLPLPASAAADTLLLSRIGYTRLAVALHGNAGAQPQRLFLKKQPVVLPPVAVHGAKLVERNYGVTRQKALVHFTDGTIRPGEAFEIAQLIRLDHPTTNLTSVNLFLAASLPDSASVVIHFYGFDGQRPTHELGLPALARRVAIRAGWLRVDLPALRSALPQDFVLGLAFAPTNGSIPYEIKLGGGAKSFARTPHASDWRVPPHHYRLYVTALVPSTAAPSRLPELDNQETPPTARLYAAAVQDSFLLYVRLPKGYRGAQKQRYPVIFLLDANAYFDAISPDMNNLPPAILVGIGYQDARLMDSLRQRDYTYPVASPADSFSVSGGGQRFLTFLTQQVLPYVDQHYHTDPGNRTLMGHSLGGYLVLYALAEGLRTQVPAFAHYVAASPSLYYGNDYLRRVVAALPAATTPLPAQTLLLTAGSRELERGDAESHAFNAAFSAYGQALSDKFPAVTLKSTIYPDYGHLETAIRTFVDGWREAYRPR